MTQKKSCFTEKFVFLLFVTLSALIHGCSVQEKAVSLTGLPESVKPYLISKHHFDRDFLQKTWTPPDAERMDWYGIQCGDLGETFHVDIDHDREIIKLKPVRDNRSVILFFDPMNRGEQGYETNSTYVQARCQCGGNRFFLAAGFGFTSGDTIFSKIILVGKCTLCSESRMLFIR
jgi:hypothetical protein